MLRAQIIGHLGSDAIVSNVNGKTVINANCAHTETWVDNAGVKNQRTIWVSMSYWTEKTSIAQYLKKGVQIFAEGGIEPKLYKPQNGGEPQAQLSMRVITIQLLGGNQSTENTNERRLATEGNHYSQQPYVNPERQSTGTNTISNDQERF